MSNIPESIKRPAKARLDEEEKALSAWVGKYRQERLAVYQAWSKVQLSEAVTERASLSGDYFLRRVKVTTATKKQMAEALAKYDAQESPNTKALAKMRSDFDLEEEVLRLAYSAPTYEQVLKDRAKQFAAKFKEGRYDSTQYVMDLALDFHTLFVNSERWANVRFMMEERGKSPVEALDDVIADVREAIVKGFTHRSRSSSQTANMERDANLEGQAKWLESLKYVR